MIIDWCFLVCFIYQSIIHPYVHPFICPSIHLIINLTSCAQNASTVLLTYKLLVLSSLLQEGFLTTLGQCDPEIPKSRLSSLPVPLALHWSLSVHWAGQTLPVCGWLSSSDTGANSVSSTCPASSSILKTLIHWFIQWLFMNYWLGVKNSAKYYKCKYRLDTGSLLNEWKMVWLLGISAFVE